MITLTKEIKAFTVLENTPATFKIEVEVNKVTNIDITVDRTNNNKATATNKQGERIIVLPYLVIEAKQLAGDNKPSIKLEKVASSENELFDVICATTGELVGMLEINGNQQRKIKVRNGKKVSVSDWETVTPETTKIDLTKTNFDYHKYDKKQVLCNKNNNNEVETMKTHYKPYGMNKEWEKIISNKILMDKVINLDTQFLATREQSLKVQIQIAIIRKAFGVKNNETNERVIDYDRERVLTDEQIEKELNDYIGYYQWAKNKGDYQEEEYRKSLYYFIEAVEFFDKELSLKFYKIAKMI